MTDVASRGPDIVGTGLVVNCDTPRDSADYAHMVGRRFKPGPQQ